MFKAIIVEDEYKIYQLISHLIDWDGLNIELIDYCPNGVAGFDTIKEKNPDIVITDMKMPGLTGVELIAKAREFGSRAEFVVISGYKEFEFARGAMTYGVTEYLLKPVNQNDLNDALRKIVDRLTQRTLTEDEGTGSEAKELLSQSFMELVLSGGANTYNLEEINRRFSLNLEKGAFRICNLVLFSLDQNTDSGLIDYLRVSFDSINNNFKNILYFQNRDSNFLFLLNYDPVQLTQEKIETTIASLFRSLNIPSTYVLGIGREVLDVTALKASCDSAEIATYGRFQETSQTVFLDGNLISDNKSFDEIVPPQDLRRLKEKADMMEAEAVANIFDSITGNFTSKTHPNHIWKFFNTVVQTVSDVIRDNLGEKEADQSKFDVQLKISSSHALWQAALAIRNWILSSINQCAESKTGSSYIRSAKSFIQEHYTEGLSLDILADHIDLNASYLSVLFKKELGVNFSDYLTDVRINAAKDLLRNTNDNISDICTKVGYSDSRHFSKVFTKKVGVKPSDYRRMIR